VLVKMLLVKISSDTRYPVSKTQSLLDQYLKQAIETCLMLKGLHFAGGQLTYRTLHRPENYVPTNDWLKRIICQVWKLRSLS